MLPTQEVPGSEGKIAVLEARLATYEPQELDLHHPDDDRTPSPPPVFEFDSQYQDRLPASLSPEQRLAAGMVKEAIESIQQFRRVKDQQAGDMTPSKAHELKMIRLDAIQSVNWIFSPDEGTRKNRLSFSDVCEAFGADPDAMRQRVGERLGGNLEEGELL